MDLDDKKLSDNASSLVKKWKKTRPDLAKRQEDFIEKQKQKGTYIKFPEELKIAIKEVSKAS